jgi:hypothetical protein
LGESIFDIDLIDLESRYHTNSRIKNITINKVYPNKIVVNIEERKGMFFLLDDSGLFHPICENQFVLDKADWYIDEDLPLLNLRIPREKIKLGQKIDDPRIDYVYDVFQTIITQDSRMLTDISELYFKNDALNIIDIKSGCRVILSNVNVDQQIERYLFLRDNQGFQRNSIIDLRFDGQVVVL